MSAAAASSRPPAIIPSGSSRPSSSRPHSGSSSSSSSSSSRPPSHSSRSSQSSSGSSSQRPSSSSTTTSSSGIKSVRSNLYCDIAYSNDIPDVPYDTKLVKMNNIANHRDHLTYTGGSLEQALPLPILSDRFAGVTVNLVDPERYYWKQKDHMGVKKMPAPADLALLSAEGQEEAARLYGHKILYMIPGGPAISINKGMSAVALDKFTTGPLYSESQLESAIRKTLAANARAESKRDKPEVQEPTLTPVELAERSFEAVKKPPVHPTDPTMQPLEVFDILPDLDLINQAVSVVGFTRTEDVALPVWSDAASAAALPSRKVRSVVDTTNPNAAIMDARRAVLLEQTNDMDSSVQGFSLYEPVVLGSKRKTTAPNGNGGQEDIEEVVVDAAPGTTKRYKWVRELSLAPVAALEPDNNFFIVIGKDYAKYGRYQRRFLVRKRVPTTVDRCEFEIEARPAAVDTVVADADKAGVPAKHPNNV